jgi:hypothetical protein
MIRAAKCRRRNQKARGRFPGAGFGMLAHVEIMQVICPTCQIPAMPSAVAGARDFHDPDAFTHW